MEAPPSKSDDSPLQYSNSRNGATPSFFINVQHLSHRFASTGGELLKHQFEPKTNEIVFTEEVLHIYGRDA